MRIIRYRGKRIDNGGWVEGYYVHVPRKSSWIIRMNDSGKIVLQDRVDPETVGECVYIGLDKKVIWTGDIVANKSGLIGLCAWDKIELKFKIDEARFYDYMGELFCWEELEVIGNIHDNPELIQQ